MLPSPPILTEGRFVTLWQAYTQANSIVIDPEWTSYEGRPISLGALHRDVFGYGGFRRVTAADGWAVIGARIGFVHYPAHDTAPAKCTPALAQRLQAVYAKYLVAFDQEYWSLWINWLAKGNSAQGGHGALTPQPPGTAQPNIQGTLGQTQVNGGMGVNHPPQAGPSFIAQDSINRAEKFIDDLRRSWAESWDLDTAPTYHIPESQKELYNNTSGRLISQLDDLERQLPVFHAIVPLGDNVRTLLVISIAARYQNEQLSATKPRFILDLHTVQSTLWTVTKTLAGYKNIMMAREAHIRSVQAALHTQRPPQSQPPGRIAMQVVDNVKNDEEAVIEDMIEQLKQAKFTGIGVACGLP
ncbi:hypothetical protein FA95DRAFT_979315 [Auriscalpium vulgare]|uniref:Uncharacterized protein n=1 Tax=Auriscalpium vulgare TaxID=40419 RepID=A0ACB8RY95_9AGAM|nr:hypothetical protein FA95DRAFT_979315 [Auriscalpium vulgare]